MESRMKKDMEHDFIVDTIELLSLFGAIVKNEKRDLVSFVVQIQYLVNVLVFFKMFYLILRVSFLSNVKVQHYRFPTSYSGICINFYYVNSFKELLLGVTCPIICFAANYFALYILNYSSNSMV